MMRAYALAPPKLSNAPLLRRLLDSLVMMISVMTVGGFRDSPTKSYSKSARIICRSALFQCSAASHRRAFSRIDHAAKVS